MTKDDKYLIIYHREDNDGLFSMAIIYNYLVDELKIDPKNIHRLGADYEIMNNVSTQPFKGKKTKLDVILDTYQHIFLTDVSFNDFKYIKKIYKKLGKEFYWIDHHAPVIKQSVKEKCSDITGERNTNRSAILNAYKFFYDPLDEKYSSKDKSIELFRILSAMDSWTYEQEGYNRDYAMDVNTGVTNKFMLDPKKVIPFVEEMLRSEDQTTVIDEFLTDGHKYNTVQDAKNRELVRIYGQEWKMKFAEDRNAVVIFHEGQTSSLWFENEREKYKNGIVFKHLNNGNWSVSLYNTSDSDDFDCGLYMKNNYGGGGHPGAAGCQIDEKQFIELLKKKHF